MGVWDLINVHLVWLWYLKYSAKKSAPSPNLTECIVLNLPVDMCTHILVTSRNEVTAWVRGHSHCWYIHALSTGKVRALWTCEKTSQHSCRNIPKIQLQVGGRNEWGIMGYARWVDYGIGVVRCCQVDAGCQTYLSACPFVLAGLDMSLSPYTYVFLLGIPAGCCCNINKQWGWME